MRRDAAGLALALGVAAQRLRQGKALDTASRAELAELLLRTAMVLGGATAPARLDADPLALLSVAIEVARESGVPAPDLVAAVNDALERSAAPMALTGGSHAR